MKDFLTKIKNFFQFKVKVNPHVYWNNLLYVFFTIIVIFIFFSFYLLYKIKNQQIFQNSDTPKETPSLMNEKLLEKITSSFNAKIIKQNEIKNTPVIYKDPSGK